MSLLNLIKSITYSVALLLFTSITSADIFVDRAIVRMAAGEAPRQDIKVINNGDDTGYVQVDVFEVKNPGTPEEERIKITNPDEISLIASPSKLMIPANSQKMVRIVNLQPGSKEERIYRINVTPVLAPLSDQENSTVRVIVAYQLLVIVDPANPQEKIDIQRDGLQLTINNEGNTNVLFSDAKQCDENETNCVDIAAHRVYPGNSWTTVLEMDRPVSMKMTSYNGIREITTQ